MIMCLNLSLHLSNLYQFCSYWKTKFEVGFEEEIKIEPEAMS